MNKSTVICVIFLVVVAVLAFGTTIANAVLQPSGKFQPGDIVVLSSSPWEKIGGAAVSGNIHSCEPTKGQTFMYLSGKRDFPGLNEWGFVAGYPIKIGCYAGYVPLSSLNLAPATPTP